MARTLATVAGLAMCGLIARAQDAMLEVRVLSDATPQAPLVQIDVWAHFPHADYAWAGTVFKLIAAGPAFAAADCVTPPGWCEAPSIRVFPEYVDATTGQFSYPPLGYYPDPANPVHILQAWWRPDDLTPRLVQLSTETRAFEVYPTRDSLASESRLHLLAEPGARIRVLDRECYADCDASGELDLFDFLCFQNLFAAGDPIADCDLSGELDLFDFLCFQNDFAAGCP